jgi:tetratricopeptide (TPR) repeat protein
LRGHALRFTTLFELGQIREADIALSAHSSLADQSGDPFERWANLVWRAARALMEGRFDDAVQYSRRALGLAQEVPGLHATDHYAPITFAGQTILIDETRDGSLPDPDVIAHFRSRYPEISAWRVAFLSGLTRSGAKDAVRHELDSLGRRDFADFDRNGTWLASMSYVSEAIELIGDSHRAQLVYLLLAPFHDRNVTVSHIASRGSASRWLGLLAATMGRWPDAEAHFQSALAMNQQMGARALVANTRHDYGRLLAKESDDCAVGRATMLLEESLLEATQLGMSGLANRCKLAIDTLSQRATVKGSTPSPTSLVLHKEQQIWILEYRGRRVHLKDSKGLGYIAALLDQATHEVHAADLVALLAPNGDSRRRESTRPTPVSTHTTEMLIDTRARRAYERRLRELSADLATAEQSGEPEQVLAMREEIGALQRELARAIGLRNRIRKTSDAERARVRVTRAIRLALARIAAADGESAAYLSRSIRTGTYCRFQPRK